MTSTSSQQTAQRQTQHHDAALAENAALREQISQLKHQLDWFKRQLFGTKSEKRIDIDTAHQADLLAGLGVEPSPIDKGPTERISYERRKKQRDANTVSESGLRFDDSVPVETIDVPNPELAGLPADDLEQISEKIVYRLAQRPGSYVILKYVRKVIKRTETQTLHTALMPANVLEKSVADVSFLAGMLVDKFLYHLPLYRQHQRLQHSGITLSRATLTNLTRRAIDLLSPIVDVQLVNILLSKILAMDETPIKAGRQKKGKMRQGYLWPVHGEQDEIVFSYTPTRDHGHVKAIIGDEYSGTLLTDGYEAYARYAQTRDDVTHAQCWSHTRRYFDRAKEAEPESVEAALALIGLLYQHEKEIRKKSLASKEKLAYRTQHSEPVARSFWQWCDQQCHRTDLLPSNPLSKALKYAMNRQASLQVFLSDPDVPLDTNHVERALRPIPMGRRNWLFCWTEIGAKQVGIIQSLLVTCKLQGVDPYTYLMDILQRISQHPASKVIELTPRVWKETFADNPLRSDLNG
jgi:transposase